MIRDMNVFNKSPKRKETHCLLTTNAKLNLKELGFLFSLKTFFVQKTLSDHDQMKPRKGQLKSNFYKRELRELDPNPMSSLVWIHLKEGSLCGEIIEESQSRGPKFF